LHCPLPTDQIDKITFILPEIGDHWGYPVPSDTPYDYLRIILYAGAYNGKSINLLKAD
jgi:hypothetical protein